MHAGLLLHLLEFSNCMLFQGREWAKAKCMRVPARKGVFSLAGPLMLSTTCKRVSQIGRQAGRQ